MRDCGLLAESVFDALAPATLQFGDQARIIELRARLNLGEINIPDDGELLAEMPRLRTKFSAGPASVINPRVSGSHGDKCQAVAMAVWEHRRPSDPDAVADLTWDWEGFERVAPVPYDGMF